ncbi:VWA domain-containing protein [Microcoleus sp.]|uniref:vWA domain-containing protein n=1 Tax=Microcoleus sp. TaxID=44472 RepID=UPI003526AD9F
MQNLFGQLRQKLSKPILFGLYGAVGCLGAATLLGEAFLALTKLPPTPRSPQAIVLLIDCSGSMNENNKLQEAKSAAKAFVQRQNLSQNSLAIVGFGSNVQVAAPLSGNKLMLDRAITQLSDGGGTRMDIAIEAAARELQSTSKPRNILLFTDGEPSNAGTTLTAGQSAKTQGINLVAVATGDANTNFLTQLTGDRSLVFYANSGDFDRAFRQAEEAIYGSQLVESGSTGDYGLVYSLLRIGGWTALLAIGTSLALIAGQNHYLRRRLLTPSEGTMGTGGSLAAGVAAGAIGQLLFLPVAGIPILALGGRVIGWTILGTFLGGGMSFFVPNLEIRRALQAGGIGGAAGAIGFLLVSAISGDLVGRLVGAAIVGFFIGLAIALIEDLSRRAWLIVHWTPSEQTPINLGTTPVIFGSSEDAHIYLRKDLGYPPVVAKIYLESGKIIMQFDEEMQKLKGMKFLRHELANGDRRKIGEVMIEVKTAMEKLP